MSAHQNGSLQAWFTAQPTITCRPIFDEINPITYDPRHPYVEQEWLPIVGPTTYVLMRHLATRLETDPEGFTLHMADCAHALGLGTSVSRTSMVIKAFCRLVNYKAAHPLDPEHELGIVTRLPPVGRRRVKTP